MNPNQIISMLFQKNPALQQNPIIQNAFRMAQNNDVQGLKTMAENVAKEKNVDINQLINQIRNIR